jgi:hypothetical protein
LEGEHQRNIFVVRGRPVLDRELEYGNGITRGFVVVRNHGRNLVTRDLQIRIGFTIVDSPSLREKSMVLALISLNKSIGGNFKSTFISKFQAECTGGFLTGSEVFLGGV